VASTGLAATLLINGSTYHSKFKLSIPINETTVSGVAINSELGKMLKNSSLIIWDECTLACKHALLAVDNLFKELMENDEPFGGKTIVLGKYNI